MHAALKIPAVLLVSAVAACGTILVQTDPDTFSVAPAAVSHLRGPQTVALINAYETPTEVVIFRKSGSSWNTDLKELTNTAIAMLGRAMEKQGIRVAPQADKTLTLRVHQVSIGMYGMNIAPQFPAKLVLEVRYLDGTKTSVEAMNVAPYSQTRAIDGAVLFALNDLVRHEQFVAYINDYRPTEADLARVRREAAAAAAAHAAEEAKTRMLTGDELVSHLASLGKVEVKAPNDLVSLSFHSRNRFVIFYRTRSSPAGVRQQGTYAVRGGESSHVCFVLPTFRSLDPAESGWDWMSDCFRVSQVDGKTYSLRTLKGDRSLSYAVP